MAFSRVLWTIALCGLFLETFANEIKLNLAKNMRWIPILVAACIFEECTGLYEFFFRSLWKQLSSKQAHSHGLFDFSKNESANRHALKTKFIFNSSLLFSKRTFSGKKSVLE